MNGVNAEQPVSVFIEPKGHRYDVAKAEAFRAGAAVDKRLLLLNNLGRGIIALERNGLKYNLESLNTPEFPRGFIVRVEYRFSLEIYKKLEKHLNAPDADQNETLKEIRENLTVPPFRRTDSSERICSLDYVIDNDVILKNGGRLYIDDIDIVIGLSDTNDELVHPYSARGRDLQMGVYLNWDKKTVGASVDLTYVPVLPNSPGLYARIVDRVVYIPPMFNPGVESGLHIDYSTAVEGAMDVPARKKRILEPPGFEQHGFYLTYDEALNGADFETAHKLALAEAEKNLALKRAENLSLDAQLKELLIKLDMEKVEAKGEQVKVESHFGKKDLRRKNKYSKKSARRDNNSAIIKNMPAIILGVAAVGVAVGKLFA